MTIGKNRRTKTLLLAACAALAIVPATAYAQAGTQRVSYGIPAQDLGTALTELARQGNREIYFSADVTRGKHARRLSGKMTFEQALVRLLEGSGLKYRVNANGSVVIETRGQEGNASAAGGEAADGGTSDDRKGVAEILVVGSRSQNVDIKRTRDDAQPYVVFSAEEVQNSGATTIDDFLRTRLPMNAQRSVNEQNTPTGTQVNGPSFDLRGLGSQQTLVLVDGRRWGGISTGFEFSQPVVSGIPMSAVERIEVLPSTAGGIYGASAVGGVINIILKHDYKGLDLQASYGNSFRWDVGRLQLGVTGGTTLEGGRTRISFNAQYQHQQPLLAVDRNFGRPALDLTLKNYPAFSDTIYMMSGPTAGVFSANGQSLVLDNGTALNSLYTYVPDGYAGPASDNGAGLAANAGKLRVTGIPGDNIYAGSTTYTGSAEIRRDMTSWLEAYISLYGDHAPLSYPNTSSAVRYLPANSPYNPFQQPIRVNVPVYETGANSRTDQWTRNLRASSGLIARLPGNWSASGDLSWSSTKAHGEIRSSGGVQYPNDALIDVGALTDIRDHPIPGYAAATVSTHTYQTQSSSFIDGSIRAGGPLFRLPGGSMTLTTLLEVKRESTPGYVAHYTTFETWLPPASQTTHSAYGEFRAPLVSAANNVPLIHSLELSGAVRWDEYRTHFASLTVDVTGLTPGNFPKPDFLDTKFRSTSYTGTARYEPVAGLTLRGSYGTGFRPPAFTDFIATPPLQDQARYFTIFDPKRGRTRVTGDPNGNLTYITGGRADMQPETSNSLSFGVIFEPRFLEGLRISVDATRIRKNNEITGVSFQYVLDNEAIFPDRVVRGPKLATDPADWAGPVTTINVSRINAFRSEVRAIDYRADYSPPGTRFGNWHFYAAATQSKRFVRQISFSQAALNGVGYADGPLEWRGNAGFDWNSGGWALGWNAQYYDSYRLCPIAFAANCSLWSDGILAQGTEKIRSQIYHDLYLKYKFGKDRGFLPLANTEIAIGIQNVFDKRPPILTQEPYYSPYGDPRLRRFTLTLRKSFGN
jgi:outer membrane receptor protein involved in Fe transport